MTPPRKQFPLETRSVKSDFPSVVSVTPRLLFQAILFATVIGLLGGVFPAIHAARLPIAAALQEV